MTNDGEEIDKTTNFRVCFLPETCIHYTTLNKPNYRYDFSLRQKDFRACLHNTCARVRGGSGYPSNRPIEA